MSHSIRVEQTGREVLDGEYFARFAKSTFDQGYSVIPLQPGEKRPHVDSGWREACWSRLPDTWIDDHMVSSPDSGVGLACGRYTVAFDIDVEDPASIEIIRSMVVEICGETPLVRVGSPPKLALVYRSLEPIVSIRLPKFDILGLGCQLVAYGSHPTTGRSYQWIGGTAPHATGLDQIPGVTNAKCVEVAASVVRRIYGDRFERFVFDTDLDVVTICFSSRKTLASQLWARLLYGTRGARERFHNRVMRSEMPPGFWGFSMRTLVRGGFDPSDFLRRLNGGELGSSDQPGAK